MNHELCHFDRREKSSRMSQKISPRKSPRRNDMFPWLFIYAQLHDRASNYFCQVVLTYFLKKITCIGMMLSKDFAYARYSYHTPLSK